MHRSRIAVRPLAEANVNMHWNPAILANLAASAFFATTFIQSSYDKLTDRKGNLEWMVPHFEKSPFNGTVPLFLTALTALEFVSGWGCMASIISTLLSGPVWIPAVSMGCVALTIVCLMTGQRWAKDYAAAASLTGYMACALIGLATVPMLPFGE